MFSFITSLKKLGSRIVGGQSIAPRDVLFDAQLPFLRRKFGGILKEVIRPDIKIDGPYIFRCRIPQKMSIKEFKNDFLDGEWGAFVVDGIYVSGDLLDVGPMTVSVHVRPRRAE